MLCHQKIHSAGKVQCRTCGKVRESDFWKTPGKVRAACKLHGIGDLASMLLKSIGIEKKPKSRCGCNQRQSWINAKTPRWMAVLITLSIHRINSWIIRY